MKRIKSQIAKLVSVLMLSGMAIIPASAMAHHGSVHEDRVNQRALRAADRYLDALADYYNWAKDCNFYDVAEEVADLYYTVRDKIQTPLANGRRIQVVQPKLRLVHQDVRRVWDVITRTNPGSEATEKFRSTNQNEKIRLMRALNNQH